MRQCCITAHNLQGEIVDSDFWNNQNNKPFLLRQIQLKN